MQVLAFDVGASNGRAIVAHYDGCRISLHEIHRFDNEPVRLNGRLYWDFLRLFFELKTALSKAKTGRFQIESLGVDTWGVDYGLIDSHGDLAGNPLHYRDDSAAKGMSKLLSLFDREALKRQTGMDCVSYNTVNQLMADRRLAAPDIQAVLNMPDLFNYFLTGQMHAEYSMATTTQLYDYDNEGWNKALIHALGFDQKLFRDIMPSGSVIGWVKEEIRGELKLDAVKVVSVTSHDTAAAIRSIAASEEDFLFIATGTWIIVGSKQQRMTMNDKVMSYALANEGGKYPDVNLSKNHIGLWLLQESKRFWEKEGLEVTYAEMIDQAEAAKIEAFIEIDDKRFFDPGEMPLKVQAYCREHGQEVPETVGEVVRVIEQSLARQIARTLSEIEEAVSKTYEAVHLIGGGVQDRLLCRLVQQYAGKKVIAGSKEATAFGNAVDQFIALGAFSEEERIGILRRSIQADQGPALAPEN